VAVNYYCEVSHIIDVPRSVFIPKPEVDSVVLKLSVRKEPPVCLLDETVFFACIKAGFGQRRKTLLNSLSGLYDLSKAEISQVLKESGIDPKRRAETLNIFEFAELANKIYKNRGDHK